MIKTPAHDDGEMPCRQAIWQEKRGEAMEEAVVEAVAAQSESGIMTQPSVVVIVLVWLLRSSLVVCGLVLAATAGVWYGVRRPTASVLVPGQSSTLATPLAFCGRLRANWACVQWVYHVLPAFPDWIVLQSQCRSTSLSRAASHHRTLSCFYSYYTPDRAPTRKDHRAIILSACALDHPSRSPLCPSTRQADISTLYSVHMYEACTPLFLQWAAAKTTSPQVQQFDTGGPLEPVKTNPGVLLVVVNFEEQEPAAVPNGAERRDLPSARRSSGTTRPRIHASLAASLPHGLSTRQGQGALKEKTRQGQLFMKSNIHG